MVLVGLLAAAQAAGRRCDSEEDDRCDQRPSEGVVHALTLDRSADLVADHPVATTGTERRRLASDKAFLVSGEPRPASDQERSADAQLVRVMITRRRHRRRLGAEEPALGGTQWE